MALGALAAALALRSFGPASPERAPAVQLEQQRTSLVERTNAETEAALVIPTLKSRPEEESDETRSDLEVERDGVTSIHRGRCAVQIAPNFASPAGEYDLLLHFHGSAKLVAESAARARLNAVVAVVNLGVGPTPYAQEFTEAGAYERLLADIDRAMRGRGLVRSKLRRVALSAWGPGDAAITSILSARRGKDPLDALLLLDGAQTRPGGSDTGEPNAPAQTAFVEAARAASSDKLFFTLAHPDAMAKRKASEPTLVNTMMDAVHGKRITSNVARRSNAAVEWSTDVRVGNFHVRGFRGARSDHQAAPLAELAEATLPELNDRWSRRESLASR